MMDKETLTRNSRADVLDTLDQLMREHPAWRIGQLVANIAFLARQSKTATWDVENEEFVEAAQKHLQQITEQRAAATIQEPALREKIAV